MFSLMNLKYKRQVYRFWNDLIYSGFGCGSFCVELSECSPGVLWYCIAVETKPTNRQFKCYVTCHNVGVLDYTRGKLDDELFSDVEEFDLLIYFYLYSPFANL